MCNHNDCSDNFKVEFVIITIIIIIIIIIIIRFIIYVEEILFLQHSLHLYLFCIHKFVSLKGMYHLMTKCTQKCNMHFTRAAVIYKMLRTPPWVPLHLSFRNAKASPTRPKGKFGILP